MLHVHQYPYFEDEERKRVALIILHSKQYIIILMIIIINYLINTSDLKGELKFHFLLMLTYKFIPLDLITNIVLTSIFFY